MIWKMNLAKRAASSLIVQILKSFIQSCTKLIGLQFKLNIPAFLCFSSFCFLSFFRHFIRRNLTISSCFKVRLFKMADPLNVFPFPGNDCLRSDVPIKSHLAGSGQLKWYKLYYLCYPSHIELSLFASIWSTETLLSAVEKVWRPLKLGTNVSF